MQMITQPCDTQALPCVHKLLEFLKSIEGKHILTGQHTQSVPMEEVEHIHEITGKYPAVCGFELLGYSPNIRRETADEACLKEVDDAYGTVPCAIKWAKRGGIVTYTWHWFSPLGGRDKSFFSDNTDFDARKALQDGTPEQEAMVHDLDVIAEILREFQQENIPILWRPFHESEGKWFWWGAKGVETARDLYRFMFTYFTTKKDIHNLIWVWNCPLPEGYVGDEYCDIITRDLYPEAHHHTDLATEYEELHRITAADKGCAVAELGVIPSVEDLEQSRVPWLWYMTWSHEFCLTEQFTDEEELKKMYASSYALTLEDISGILAAEQRTENAKGWIFSKAERRDFPRLNELFVEMLQAIYHTDRVNGYTEGDMDRFFEGKEDWVCTVVDRDTIIAFLSIEVHHEETDFLYLDDMSVSESYRNQGIGTALFERAQAYAKERKISQIRLHVESENTSAFRLYTRLGYTVKEEQGSRCLMQKEL